MQVMETALNHVAETFRLERKEYQARINQALQLKELVEGGRYTFQQALDKLEARVDWIAEAYVFMALDNMGLNDKYGTDVHQITEQELYAQDWLFRMDA